MTGASRSAGLYLMRGLALAGALASAGGAFADDALKDAAGHPVIARDASRTVAVGGSITEILYALGAQDKIAAVDVTSQYPPQALRDKPNVGYMRQLSPEGVLGVRPSLIIATEGSGPKETLAVLEAAKIPLVLVPDHFTADGIVEKVKIVSRSIGDNGRGTCIVNVLNADFKALDRLRGQIKKPVRVMFILSFVNNRAMAAGRKTAADGIIRLAGGVNAITDYEGYKPVGDEAIVASKPDVVLAMTRSHTDPLTAEKVFAHPALSTTPAAKQNAFHLIEALYMLGFGPRTALAARDLFGQLYPSLKTEPFPSERDAGSLESCVK
ncbi:MAG: hemin ABC transporter substrate-binding protein [Pseudolabrys sp.]